MAAESFTAGGLPLPNAELLRRDPILLIRFWTKVELFRSPEKCWLWQAKIGHNGYGYFALGRRSLRAHRVAFALHHGRWPVESLMILHSCHNRACVNPNHLREGTAAENQADVQERIRERNEKGIESWRGGNPPAQSLRGGSALTPESVKLIRQKLDISDGKIDEAEAAMLSITDLEGAVSSSAVIRAAKGQTFQWVP